ncbi:MAG: flippase-like domain-containing protein [Ignavibacteria bacterium]|nr:flippase-like domain-containing protein [Ignavibacteria bacterium]
MVKKKKLNILISISLVVFFLYLAFRNVNFSELFEILQNTNYIYVFIGTFTGVVIGSLIRSARWKVLLEPVSRGLRFRNLFSSTVIGYMFNNFFPRSGEIIRPYILGKQENISKASAFATVIVERIIDTVMFLLMFAVALIYFKDSISRAIPEIGSAVLLLSLLIFLLLLCIIFMMLKPETALAFIKFFSKFLPDKIHKRVDDIFSSMLNGFDVLKTPSLFLKLAFYSLMLWIAYLLSAYIPFYSFGILTGTTLLKGLWNANLLLVLINVAMFVPSPAATGPYHWICKVTLMNMFYVSEAASLGYATATHAMMFLMYLVMGIYFLISYNYKISEIKEVAEEKL